MKDPIEKRRDRESLESQMAAFLKRGGQVKKVGPLTVEDQEATWREQIPQGLKNRMEAQKRKREQQK